MVYTNLQTYISQERINIPRPSLQPLLLALQKSKKHRLLKSNYFDKAFLKESKTKSKHHDCKNKESLNCSGSTQEEDGKTNSQNKYSFLDLKPDRNLLQLESIILNFYGLYFAHRELFCKKVVKNSTQDSDDKNSEEEVEKETKQNYPPKKMNMWSRFKSFFSSKNKKESENNEVIKPLQMFIEQSRMNQLNEHKEKYKFEYPGLKETEVENFLMVYYAKREHLCDHCQEEKTLIIRILQKDITNKIFHSSAITENSIKVLTSKHISDEFYPNYMSKAASRKKLNLCSINDLSTRSNTNFLMSPKVGIFSSSKNGKKNFNWGSQKQINTIKIEHNKFSEYDYEEKRNKNLKRKESQNKISNNFSLKKFRSKNNLKSSSSNQKVYNFDYFGDEKNQVSKDNKFQRIKKRKKSRISNFFNESEKKKLSFTDNSEENGRAREIFIPKSIRTFNWNNKSPDRFTSPTNKMTNLNFLGNKTTNKKSKIMSMKDINLNPNKYFNKQSSKNSNTVMKRRFSVSRNNKNLQNNLLNSSRKSTQKRDSLPIKSDRKSVEVFRLEAMDKLDFNKMKEIDFSRMNTKPIRF